MKFKAAITVFKKEMKRFFGDKRLCFGTIFLPGLLIFVMYTLMGVFISGAFTPDKSYRYKVAAVGFPEEIRSYFSPDIEFSAAEESDVESLKADVKAENIDAVIIFPKDFIESLGDKSKQAPQIAIYYNNEKAQSSKAYELLCSALDKFETEKSNLFDVNAGGDKYDLADEKNVLGKILASFLPMLLMIMLFTGAVNVTPESIAGEKERGTIAALLVTPASRGGIAMGKILALSVISLLGGIGSTLGVALSLPNLTGGALGELNLSYTAGDIFLLLLVIASAVLLIVAALSLISAMAKTVKEAASLSSPLMFILIGISFFNMFEFPDSPFYYFIPFFNSLQCMGAIFSFSTSFVDILITVVANLVYTALAAWGLTKMFDNERVIFGK